MQIGNHFTAAPMLLPMFNVGMLQDLQTGSYYVGEFGESIMNGGVPSTVAIVARGNVGKSILMHTMHLIILARYASTQGNLYETEISGFINRIVQLGMAIPGIEGVDLQELGRLVLNNTITPRKDNKPNLGDLWFDDTKNFWEEKRKGGKEFARTLPFIDKTGQHMKTIVGSIHEVDSFSMFTTSPVANMHDENMIGNKGNNTDNMRDALIKTQMLMQLPSLTGSSGAYVLMSAHVGDDIPMDPRAPPPKKLDSLRQGKIKNVPEKFTFLTNVCWYMSNSRSWWNDTTKGPEFPRSPGEELKFDPDLKLVGCIALRLKSGLTGMPFELVLSQTEGILVGLTEFNYIKTFKYGIDGLGSQSFSLELLPDVKLTRTTLRQKLRENPVLQRAMEITSELCQLNTLPNWLTLDKKYKCTAKVLRADLEKLGYDWNILLATRGYWIYLEDEDPNAFGYKPFLSTMDLLRMRTGEYKPYWLADDKKTIISDKKKWKKHSVGATPA
jgi:hypothetical protein